MGRQPWDYSTKQDGGRRERPSTMMYCSYCEQYVLRSEWDEHEEHDLEERGIKRYADHGGSNLIEEEKDIEDEPEADEIDDRMQVGSVYSVTLDYNAKHTFRVAAGNEGAARTRAQDQVKWGTATDGHLLHSDVREVEPIYEGDDKEEELYQ